MLACEAASQEATKGAPFHEQKELRSSDFANEITQVNC